jgi:hypothetical protein
MRRNDDLSTLWLVLASVDSKLRWPLLGTSAFSIDAVFMKLQYVQQNCMWIVRAAGFLPSWDVGRRRAVGLAKPLAVTFNCPVVVKRSVKALCSACTVGCSLRNQIADGLLCAAVVVDRSVILWLSSPNKKLERASFQKERGPKLWIRSAIK